MKNRKSNLFFILIVILSILLLAGLMWATYRFSLENPVGQDFLPRWLGTRLFLLEGQSPYGEQTSRAIEDMYQQRYGSGGEATLAFMYPLYSIFIFAPFALIPDYGLALTVWLTVLELSVIAIALTSLSLCRWKLKPIGIIAILILAALWYHNIRSLISGDAILLVVCFVSITLLAFRAKQDGLAGFFLALSMIEPQIIILLVIFLLIWCFSSRRWMFIWSFIGSLALMIVFTSLIIPDWTWQNFKQIFISLQQTLPVTPGTVLTSWIPGVGKQLGWALTIFLLSYLLWAWRGSLHKEFRQVLWTACLTLAITPLIGLRTSIDNYSMLFPGMILTLATWHERWGKLGRWLVVIGSLIMLIGLWAVVINSVRGGTPLEMNPLVFFFAPVLILVGLYWVRWWAINPPRLELDFL